MACNNEYFEPHSTKGIVLVLLFLLIYHGTMQAQSLPTLQNEGYAILREIPTESGPQTFMVNQLATDGTNFTKVFGDVTLNTTLHSDERRTECYSKSLLLAAQLPVTYNGYRTTELEDLIFSMAGYSGEAAEIVEAINNLQTAYKPANTLANQIDNLISRTLRKLNPKSHGGIPLQTTNLQHLSKALKTLDYVQLSVDIAYNAVLREALATDLAVSRILLLRDQFNSLERAGRKIDPAIKAGISAALKTLETSDTYYGALLVEITDRRSELVQMGVAGALDYTKKHYAQQALGKYYAKAGIKAASTKGAAVAGLWTWSILATYKTIVALLDQHEKLQVGITSATLAYWLQQRIAHGSNPALTAMQYQAEYTYYDQVFQAHSGLLPGFRDFIDNLIYKEKYNRQWRDHYRKLRAEMGEALEQVTLYPMQSPPPNTTGSASGVTLGFIIDSSGSMKSSDPNGIRKTALEQIIDLIAGREKLILVDFDNNARWLNANDWQHWQANALKRKVRGIDAQGGTDVGAGLQTARKSLQKTGYFGDRTGVMLLSDGKGSYRDQAEWFRDKGIRVYTVSYKQNADAALLSSIASTTGGIYLQANNEHEIVAAFMQFYNDLLGNSKFVSFSGDLSSGKTQTPDFYVDPSTQNLVSVLNWTGNPKSMKLQSPTGSEITPSTPGSNWTQGASYSIVRVPNPDPGKWKALIKGQPGGTSGNFLFEATGRTADMIQLVEEGAGGGLVQYLLEAVNGNLNWKELKATVLLETPKSNLMDISNRFRDGKLSFYPSEGPGNYIMKMTVSGLDASGNHVQRHFSRAKLIGEVLPGYIAPVSRTMGSYVYTDQGLDAGNRPGIRCYIYETGGSKTDAIASGYVTSVNQKGCTINIQQYLRPARIQEGFTVELDLEQWSNDHPYIKK